MSTVPFNRSRRAPLSNDLAKKLPSNLEAERSVLGAILLDNGALAKAATMVGSSDFLLTQHQIIFRHMMRMNETKQAIDLITLTEEMHLQGDLEASGGAPYLASLADGMPKVSNVEHYARIVKQKATLRSLIHTTHHLQTMAFNESQNPDELLEHAETQIKEITRSPNNNPAVVVGFQSLLTRQCAPIEYAIDPLLSKRGTGEIWGWRGVGKSLIATSMAVKIAKGEPSLWAGHRGVGGHWNVTRKFPQLYVYGEMDESEIQQRMITIAKMEGLNVPTDEELGTICMDFQKGWRPRISTAKDRKIIEDRLFAGGYEGLWLDNLSTLWPTSGDGESERDAILAEWYTDLNQRGIWVIWLHHAGKGGEQRGGSQKEDMLSFVLKLHRPKREEMRVIVSVEKNRHKCDYQRLLMPFEISLRTSADGQLEWLTRPAQESQRVAAFEMFKNKMPTMLVGQEVGVSRATAYRWQKEYNENPNPDFHSKEDQDE